MLMAAKPSKNSPKKPRGRPPKGRHKNSIAFAASDELLATIERFHEALERASPGFGISRSDAIRFLIQKGLQAAEAGTQPQLPLEESSTKKP